MIVRDREIPTEPGLQAGPQLGTIAGAGEAECLVRPASLRFVTMPLPRPRSLRSAWTALVAPVLFACGAPAAAPVPAPLPAPAPPVADPLESPWIVSTTAGSIAHRLVLESELTSRVDSVVAVDSVRTEGRIEWSRLAGEPAGRLSGLITAYGMSRDTLAPVAPAGLMLPMPVAAQDARGEAPVVVQRPDPAACGLEAAAAALLREVVVAPPRRLERGTTWHDSASYTICRDSIPLAVTSRREYRVTGAERRGEALVVLVERRSRLTLQGEGRQFGEAIAISAEGEGLVTLAVRTAGAFVLDGSGESTLRMTMRGRRRSQELTQHTRITISTAP